VHGDQDARIEDLLDPGDRRGLVFQSNRGVQGLAFGIRQRLAEIPQRGLEPPCLLCQRLQWHGSGRAHGRLLIGTKRAPERNRGGEQEESLSNCAAHARVVSRLSPDLLGLLRSRALRVTPTVTPSAPGLAATGCFQTRMGWFDGRCLTS
jgi:hypothetical protein